MNNEAITLNQFSFRYGSKDILTDITFSIAEGEYVAIIGPNGAGKSTLLKSINRIVKGGQGSLTLFGKDVHAYTQRELGQIVGYVSQNREQLFPFSVFEFVLMGRYPHRTPLSRITKQDEHAVEEALAITGLTDFALRKVSSLSGGERQKVYLAGALAQQPKILLLDEPTTHLDPRYHVELQKTISDIGQKTGVTIVHVTHDLNHIFSWSQKVVVIKEGRLHSIGSPKDILSSKQLNDIFETDFLVTPHPKTHQPIIIPESRL